jgi:hypothetical protein
MHLTPHPSGETDYAQSNMSRSAIIYWGNTRKKAVSMYLKVLLINFLEITQGNQENSVRKRSLEYNWKKKQ